MNYIMNPLKLFVRTIIGEAIDGYVRVAVNIDAYDAMAQSVFARRNRQTALLTFLRKTDEGGNNFTQFYFNGVEVRRYFVTEPKKQTILLMKEENAKALLNTEPKEAASLSKFNLSTVIVA